MTDAFALLAEPRRPGLDVVALKQRFLAQSAPFHPDRVHSASEAEKQSATQHFAELNSAFNTLREPRDRLLHLLELEAGAKPRDIQRIPPGTMDLFVDIGQTCRDCDAFLARKQAGTGSPMLQLRFLQEGLEWIDRLNTLQGRVNQRRDELLQELAAMNATWETAPPVGDPARAAALPLSRLEEIYRGISYVARWTEQLRERMVALAT